MRHSTQKDFLMAYPQGFPEEDLPITLKDASEVVFKGAISVASLKAEHSRGNLEITKIGKTYFTSRKHLAEMLAKCRVEVPPRRFEPARTEPSTVDPVIAQGSAEVCLRDFSARLIPVAQRLVPRTIGDK